MNADFSNYQLFLGKDTPERQSIREMMLPYLTNLETTFVQNTARQIWNRIKKVENFKKMMKKYSYAFIDILILRYYSNQLEEVITFLTDIFDDYFVIHELAALAWGNELIEPNIIFEYLPKLDLSGKHIYHILTEMSITFPIITIEEADNYKEKNIITESHLRKLQKKIMRVRKKNRKLAKGITPKLTFDEVKSHIAYHSK